MYSTCLYVFCSNGVGRTGVFLALNHEYRRSRKEDSVDVLHYTMVMRTDRANMVETTVSNIMCAFEIDRQSLDGWLAACLGGCLVNQPVDHLNDRS